MPAAASARVWLSQMRQHFFLLLVDFALCYYCSHLMKVIFWISGFLVECNKACYKKQKQNVSFAFEDFPFPIFQPLALFLPPYLWGNKKWEPPVWKVKRSKNFGTKFSQQANGLKGGWGGLPTGNGKKLSSSQTQLSQATCLAVAYFLSISCGSSTPSAL